MQHIDILKPTAKLISITPDAEKTMAYIARVSNPSNQYNENIANLIKYCFKHGHFSVFEQAYMTIELETHLAIAVQALRHGSFKFQMFSQRYSNVDALGDTLPLFELREQDTKNRQNSTDTLAPDLIGGFHTEIVELFSKTLSLYTRMLAAGVAKESARFILPQATKTRFYMSGNIRNWIFYILERTKDGVQLEHKQLATLAKSIFVKELPILSEVLEWKC